MRWLRKKLFEAVIREIRENGLEIGAYLIIEKDGALTITKRVG
jgi:hypothetical protein